MMGNAGVGATIEDGKLSIDLGTLLDAMSEEERGEVAKHLAFDEALITAALGVAESGWAFGDWSMGTDTATRIRLGLVPLMDKVVQELVGHLLRQRDVEALEHLRWQGAYWKLWHHHNDTRDRECGDLAPEHPKFISPAWPQGKDTQRIIDEAREKWGMTGDGVTA